MIEKKISESLESLCFQSQFIDELGEIQEADEDEAPELLEKLKAKVQTAICLEKIIVDLKDFVKMPTLSKKTLLPSLKDLEITALQELGIGFSEQANLRAPAGRNPAFIMLSRDFISRFKLSIHKRYLVLLVDKRSPDNPIPLKEFLAKLNALSLKSETLWDDVDAIIQWMDAEPCLERLIINLCFTEKHYARALEWKDHLYLMNLGIKLLEQQAIQIPKGHNQPRISMHQDLIKSKGIDLQGDYFLLIIPQQLRLSIAEKYKDIIQIYKEMEQKEEDESMTHFIYSLSKEQVIDLLNWRIDEFAESVNLILEPNYKAHDWEGQVLERIEHLRRLIKESSDKGIAGLAFVFIRQSINRRILKERELAKSK